MKNRKNFESGKIKMLLGFTLVELMVVIVIIGILASIVVVNVGGTDVEAKQAKAKAEVKAIYDAIGIYKTRVGEYPESLEQLIEGPPDFEGVWRPLLQSRSVPRDPWNNDYIYELPEEGGQYVVKCLGADNAEGGTGENKDIIWPPEKEE